MPGQKQVGSTLTVDHMISSSSADVPPTSSRGSGRSTDHSPVRAVVRRRAERDRKKQHSYDHGAASNVETRTPYKTAGVHQSIQQAPSASLGDAASDTLHPPRHGSRSNTSSLRPGLVPTSASLDIQKSPRRSPSAIANADSIRSSSPRSYTPKGTPPHVPKGSLQSRNTCSRQNNPPLPARQVITTTALSPSSSPPSRTNLQVRQTEDNVGSSPENVKCQGVGTRALSRLQRSTPPGSPPLGPLLTPSPLRATVSYDGEDHDSIRRGDATENPASHPARSNHRNKDRARMAGGEQVFQMDHNQRQQRDEARAKYHADPSQIDDESGALVAVERLRAEMRGAITGLHIDLIKTSRSLKVTLQIFSIGLAMVESRRLMVILEGAYGEIR